MISVLKDGSTVDLGMIEISSFPEESLFTDDKNNIQRENANVFLQLITDFYNTSNEVKANLEFLWTSEPIKGQSFNSKVHVYIIVRFLNGNKSLISGLKNNIVARFLSLLKTRKFGSRVLEDEEIESVYSGINTENFCLKSKEIHPVFSPIYQVQMNYSDVLPTDGLTDLSSIVQALSFTDRASVSLQVFPIKIDNKESYALAELLNVYSQLMNTARMQGQNDTASVIPYTVAKYYYDNQKSPLFSYNILISGSNSDIDYLSTSIDSVISSADSISQVRSLKKTLVKGYKVSLQEEYSFYPWNFLAYSQHITGKVYGNVEIQLAEKMAQCMTGKEVRSLCMLPNYSDKVTALSNAIWVDQTEILGDDLSNASNIMLGNCNLSAGNVIPIRIKPDDIAKHMLVVGTPGAGKTTFALGLLLQLNELENAVPFLAIEPTKAEYRTLIECVDNLQVFTPGNSGLSPFIINPFIPVRGVNTEAHKSALSTAFEAAFSMPSPLDILFRNALDKCYLKYGWKSDSCLGDIGTQLFGLHEFIIVFKQVIEEGQYTTDLKARFESAGVYRLLDLINKNADVFDNIHTIPIEDLISKPTVIEMNAIGNDEDKSLILALLLKNIEMYIKKSQASNGRLRNVILVDEAHVFLANDKKISDPDKSNPKEKAATLLVNMLAEVRSYGVGIVIADQSPERLPKNVIRMTNTKVAFRLNEKEEIDAIVDSLDGDENERRLFHRIQTGEALVHWNVLSNPLLIKTVDTLADKKIPKYILDEELLPKLNYWKGKEEWLRPYKLCAINAHYCHNCSRRLHYDSIYYANKYLSHYKKKMNTKEKALEYIASMDLIMKDAFEGKGKEESNRLYNCILINIVRSLELESKIRISANELRRYFRT